MARDDVAPARVYLGLGSNLEPEANLRLAIDELRARYGPVHLSPVYRNRAIGFDGADFLNMVVSLDTTDGIDDIRRQIEQIHDRAGRQRGADRFTSRSLDIDLLLYDAAIVDEPRGRLPRPDILRYDFVLKPLADLAPDLAHPETGRTMREHWAGFDGEQALLVRVPLTF